MSSHDSKPDNYQINAKICRLVERYPCMYDRSHQYYLKKDVVDKAWVKIAKEMDDSISSCKERWRNIRTSFARSINVNKVPASANRTKPYYLHEELQFLARHITPGIPVSRRSNAYYSAGEDNEAIEVSRYEESFDGFTQMEEDDSQGQQSSSDEYAGGLLVKKELLLKQQQQPLQQQHQEDSEELLQGSQHQAQQQQQQTELLKQTIEDDQHDVKATQIMQIFPPKKRQRTTDILVPIQERESDRDVKTLDCSTNLETDFDASFLQGLLPEMKSMNFHQKIVFKRRIYEVIGDIFEMNHSNMSNLNSTRNTVQNSNQTTTTTSCKTATTTTITPSTANSHSSGGASITYAAAAPSTMTVVNAADLAMIRRLNSLLQSSPIGSSGSVTAVPKNVASISSTVRSTTPATTTVAVHRGTLTRSSANLLRVTMVNPPALQTASSSIPNQQIQIVKEEPNVD